MEAKLFNLSRSETAWGAGMSTQGPGISATSSHTLGRISLKHEFSKQHLQAAEFFTSKAREMETNIPKPNETQFSEHRAYVTAAVLSAVSFLEASINELYLSAIDQSLTALPGFDARLFQLLARFWTENERSPILDKYQDMLLLAGKDRFLPGVPPYQPVNDVVKLRDALVHYKPEWQDEAGQSQNLEKRLHRKFPLNPYASSGSLWFPHQCLGAGCAQWAVDTTRNFSDSFCDRLTIPRRSI